MEQIKKKTNSIIVTSHSENITSKDENLNQGLTITENKSQNTNLKKALESEGRKYCDQSQLKKMYLGAVDTKKKQQATGIFVCNKQ